MTFKILDIHAKENIMFSFVSFVIIIIKSRCLVKNQNKSQYNIDLRLDTNVKCHYILYSYYTFRI